MTLFAFLLCSVTSQAQQRQTKSPEQRAENQTRWMQKNLGITAEQSTKVHDIILYYAGENDKAKADAPGREKRMDKKAKRKGREQELRDVLTPDQYAKYQAHMQEMKDRARERRRNMQAEY